MEAKGPDASREVRRAAREHGTNQDEEAFKGVLRELAKPKI